MGVNFKKAFYEVRLCRVLFKSIAVGDSITHHFSLLLFRQPDTMSWNCVQYCFDAFFLYSVGF